MTESDPPDNATMGGSINDFPKRDNITITFPETMDPDTVTPDTICLQDGGVGSCLDMGGPTTDDNIIFIFNPSDDLTPGKRAYTLTITTDVKDTSGNSHTGYVINFSTCIEASDGVCR